MPTDISWDLAEKVIRELAPGEIIQWREQPIPWFFSRWSAATFFFAIPWLAILALMHWNSSLMMPAGPTGIDWFEVPFVLAGVGMLATPLWVYRKSRTTVYVITNKRAFILEASWKTDVESFGPERLQEITLREARNGTGDVILGQRTTYDSDSGSYTFDIGFMRVREPRMVEDRLRNLAKLVQNK